MHKCIFHHTGPQLPIPVKKESNVLGLYSIHSAEDLLQLLDNIHGKRFMTAQLEINTALPRYFGDMA